MTTLFWIEKAWGDSVANATMDDVKIAIQETINMDDEHGAFWVTHDVSECTLEVHKDMEIFYVNKENEQIKTRLSTWVEVEHLYELFFDNDYEQLKTLINNRIA
jgi:hypothetical protein